MIKTIIADDESHARERLRYLLDRFDLFDIVAEAADGNEALNMIITHNPDVAFLDINMPGISVFQSLPSLHKPPVIIFQTAYSEHAAEAFDIDALDYLLKPVRYERLEKTVIKIQETLKRKAHKPDELQESSGDSFDRISVKINSRIKIIEVKDIVRISFENGFCYIYTPSEKFISDKYLNYYEEKLDGRGFFRTSRTDIVNLEAISVIQSLFQGMYTIELKNGMCVDLSRRKAQILKKIVDF
ncbi:LytR/AlgR family response regulator transcription factor [Fibrobacterota bacterium]